MIFNSYLSKKRIQYLNALEQALNQMVICLSDIPDVEQVILFGSYLEGKRDLFTDLDLIVVMKSEQDFLNRTAALYERINISVDVDMLVYTPEEWKTQRNKPFFRHAVQHSQVLYEKRN